MDLTNLNAAKQSIVDGKVNAGVMQVDAQKYYIPLDEILTLFTEVASALTELDGKIDALDDKIDILDARIDALEE